MRARKKRKPVKVFSTDKFPKKYIHVMSDAERAMHDKKLNKVFNNA